MRSEDDSMSKHEKLLHNALRMDHEMARGIVFESLTMGKKLPDEDLAFAHIYNCIESACGKFWQEMLVEYSDPESQRKLRKHENLAKIMEAGRDRMFPTLNPFWEQRN